MNSKRSERNKQIADIVFASVIFAIILILNFTTWGYPKFGLIELTIVHIPVLVGAIMLGKNYGLFFGTVYGFGSFIMSFTNPSIYAPFTNPFVSLFPRILFGYAIGYIYEFLNKKINSKFTTVPLTLGIATLVHSLLVLPFYYIVVKYEFFLVKDEFIGSLNTNIFVFMFSAIIANSVIEIAAAVILGTAIVLPLQAIKLRNEFGEY